MALSAEENTEKQSREGRCQEKWGTSNWDYKGTAARIHQQYFAENPTNDDQKFKRCYHVSWAIFARVYEPVIGYNSYFVQKRDAIGKLGIASVLILTADYRILACGIFFHVVIDSLGISRTTAETCMLRFFDNVAATLEEEYLQAPNENHQERIVKDSQQRDHPDSLGSTGC